MMQLPESPFANLFAELKLGTPELIMELPNSWVVLSDDQYLEGYCVLILKEYVVELHHLPGVIRQAYLNELALVAEAVQNATGCHKLNIESLGNQVDHLHFHVIPRYVNEDPEMAKKAIWLYPKETWEHRLTAFQIQQITANIRTAMMQLFGKYDIKLTC